jgi:glycosyltransferase involved in cell wall biosynthesis
MRVAMIAPPWIALPVKDYGGIEIVMEGLINGLLELGVEVEVFGNGERKMKGVKTHSLYKTDQYSNIDRPLYESIPILTAHMEFALTKIKEDGGFDVIHDHNGFIGPELLAWATNDPKLPPIVHTLHGPPFSNEAVLAQGLPDNRPFWQQLANHLGRMYVVGISNALVKPAPEGIRSHILPTVYNAIEVEKFPFVKNKKNYFMTLGRFSRDKGQHIAARICAKKGLHLRMAGAINGIGSNKKLLSELANPLSVYRGYNDFRYYSDNVLPFTIQSKKITYSGSVSPANKLKFLSEAKAFLFPIDWEEPFGMVVIEALACGTPVVAMNRGAVPEIIEHGVTGFLANNEKEFEEYMDRVSEIDPIACRKAVEKKFSASTMASAYLQRYKQAIRLNGKGIKLK